MKDNELEYLLGLRKEALRFLKIGIACIVLLPFIGISFMRRIGGTGSLIFLLQLGGAVFCLIQSAKKGKEYKNYYKQTYITRLIHDIMPDAEYLPNSGFPSEMVAKTGMMTMGNIYHSEDYIRGTYNGVFFERADMCIADETTDSDGNTSTTTYLKGRWMVFPSNKDFEADLQIIQKGFSYAKKKKGLFTKKVERRHVIQTEDEDFNKRFTCLCQNDAEAFYLLTPAMMESLKQMCSDGRGKFMVGFTGNRIHVAVHTGKDYLEASLFRKPELEASRREIIDELDAVTKFIGALKLERDIFR